MHDGRLRADVPALDVDGRILGVIEVIRTNAPDERKMEEQARLGFAYRRVLAYGGESGYWFCSDGCRLNGELWEGDTLPDKPPRCGVCERFFFSNPISPAVFVDWEDPYDGPFCIECAIREYPEGGAQWQSPGEILWGDPREYFDDGADDPAVVIYRVGNAAFWRMVWRKRQAKPSEYNGSRPEEANAAEEATRRQLTRIDAAFERGDYDGAARLLMPIAAPQWSWLSDEGERMLAFNPDNCRRVAESWERIFDHIIETLPPALAKARAGPNRHDLYLATPCAELGMEDCDSTIGECERWCNHGDDAYSDDPEHRQECHACRACETCTTCGPFRAMERNKQPPARGEDDAPRHSARFVASADDLDKLNAWIRGQMETAPREPCS